jgi:hypothetical protein
MQSRPTVGDWPGLVRVDELDQIVDCHLELFELSDTDLRAVDDDDRSEHVVSPLQDGSGDQVTAFATGLECGAMGTARER